MSLCLAVDIGASGGRHILGAYRNGKLTLEEIYRFSNAPVLSERGLVWDVERLFDEVVKGLSLCAKWDKIPETVAIDMWAVDYALIDAAGGLINPVYSYRGERGTTFTSTLVPIEEMYAITGIPPHPFNTVYQLLADKDAGRIEKAEHLLMLPEYFSYRLTGRLKDECEYTNASSTGLLDAQKRDWAYGLIDALGLPRRLFPRVREPIYDYGDLSTEIRKRVGFNARVLMCASHDTASAVSLLPQDALYISSGTWSLLGVQSAPILTEAALKDGYANEGALNGKIRFLKNIIGLWMLQRIRAELEVTGKNCSFSELESLAKEAAERGDEYSVDVNSRKFINPFSMIEAIKEECRLSDSSVPSTLGGLALCVYQSLASSYQMAVEGIEAITGRRYGAVHIIGGGSKDDFLNHLTARYTGRTVYAGPSEAAAAGSLFMQMRYTGGFSGSIWDAVMESFDIKKI
ncbi:MAG: rhamnulokinase [Treponema sp.]|jgi:rhamnulokinase|nr:rhamnulokinase [Treponema sp.]